MYEYSTFNILRWLKSKSVLTLSNDDAYYRILSDRGISEVAEASEIGSDMKELLTADLYMELFFYPTQITESINDQGYSNSASVQTASNDEYYEYALGVYKRLDRVKYESYTETRGKFSKLDIHSGWI